MLKKLNRGFKLISAYFYYTAKPKFLNPIALARYVNDIRSKSIIEKSYPSLFMLIEGLLAESSSTGCEYGDYLNLYRRIRTGRYKHILECGSGISTAVMALASKENFEEGIEKSTIVSMEESEFYYNQIKRLFPPDLQEFVSFCHSKRVERMYGNNLGCHYECVPDNIYDFIYIDGPTDRKKWNDTSSPKCFNSDIFNINKSDRFEAILDQRIWTLRALRELAPNFDYKYYPAGKYARIRLSKVQR
jgi:hypothetical protein